MQIEVNLNEKRIIEKVTNDRFGTFVSKEWKSLIDPYTPRDTGSLMDSVDVQPFGLHYRQKYADAVYHGENMNFRKINPYSTYEWDIKAAQGGQLSKLYRTLNAGLQSGRF